MRFTWVVLALAVSMPVHAQATGDAPGAPPSGQPAPPPQAKNLPPPPNPQSQAQAPAASSKGQWVYTQQYGWLWMPYGSEYVYSPDADSDYAEPYAYVYEPAYGWNWVVAPWVWGFGPRVSFGFFGPWRFPWYRGYAVHARPGFHATLRDRGGFRGGVRGGGFHGGGSHGHR